MSIRTRGCRAGLVGAVLVSSSASAALLVLDSATPTRLGTLVSTGFDATSGGIWVYGDFSATLTRVDSDGVVQQSLPRPGEGANDADLEFAPVALTLNATPIPAGTLLFINGESGTAEIYA